MQEKTCQVIKKSNEWIEAWDSSSSVSAPRGSKHVSEVRRTRKNMLITLL
jgi:hypothetical protein